MQLAAKQPEYRRFAVLFLISYTFLLRFGTSSWQQIPLGMHVLMFTRLPSEGLPLVIGRPEENPTAKTALFMEGDEIVLVFRTRKNKLVESKLVRKCWCTVSPSTCPVHKVMQHCESMLYSRFCLWQLGRLCAQIKTGTQPFRQITAASARRVLREMLGELRVKSAALYDTHDLRRGHALDLQQASTRHIVCSSDSAFTLHAGVPLNDLLRAGGWKRPPFLRYLKIEDLDRDLVLRAHVDESSSDSEEGNSEPSGAGSSSSSSQDCE